MNLNFHRLNVINVSQVSTATSVIFSIPSWPVKSWDEHHGLRPCWLCPQQQEPQRWDFKAKKYWTQKQNSARMDPNGPHICATYADSYIPYILHSSTFAWPCLSLSLNCDVFSESAWPTMMPCFPNDRWIRSSKNAILSDIVRSKLLLMADPTNDARSHRTNPGHRIHRSSHWPDRFVLYGLVRASLIFRVGSLKKGTELPRAVIIKTVLSLATELHRVTQKPHMLSREWFSWCSLCNVRRRHDEHEQQRVR